MSNTRFALTALCFVGLAFIMGALFQANYLTKQHDLALSSLTDREIEAEHTDTYTLAGVSLADSLVFEYEASEAHNVDYPEEQPEDGDEMCAYICGDTIFVEYWHGFGSQVGRFRYRHGE